MKLTLMLYPYGGNGLSSIKLLFDIFSIFDSLAVDFTLSISSTFSLNSLKHYIFVSNIDASYGVNNKALRY